MTRTEKANQKAADNAGRCILIAAIDGDTEAEAMLTPAQAATLADIRGGKATRESVAGE